MLWIFVAVFVVSTGLNTCAENLTAIVWQSDVNTLELLSKAFENKNVKAFEVDVKFGLYEAPNLPPTTSTTPKTGDTSSTDSTGEDTSSTDSTGDNSSTTENPNPDLEPEIPSGGNWDGDLPVEPEDPEYLSEKLQVEPEEDLGFDFYQVVPEESLTIDETEFKTTKEVIIDQGKVKSNLKFTDFLDKAIEHSKTHGGKSIKFNFKDLESVKPSISYVQYKHREVKFSVWLHADVTKGPNGDAAKIQADKFIAEYQHSSNNVLSLGWTTKKSSDSKTGYTEEHTKAMTKIVTENIKKNNIEEPLNVALRAVYIPESTTFLKNFFNETRKTHPKLTYSIWADKDDDFKHTEIQNFVQVIGVDNVYLTLTQDKRDKLNLGNGASGLVQFGLLNLVTLAVVTIFRNGLN